MDTIRFFIKLATLNVAVISGMAMAQNVPSNATPGSNNKPVAWASNSTITVYIDVGSIPQGGPVYNAIVNRVNIASNMVGNGVTYTSPAAISGCPSINMCPLVAGPVQLFKVSSLPSGTPSQNYQIYNTNTNSGSIQPEVNSTITLDPTQMNTFAGVLSTDYVTRIVAHEMMHDYGAGDAPEADPSQTVMSYAATPDNPGLLGPSAYDIGIANSYIGSGEDGGGPCQDPSYCHNSN